LTIWKITANVQRLIQSSWYHFHYQVFTTQLTIERHFIDLYCFVSTFNMYFNWKYKLWLKLRILAVSFCRLQIWNMVIWFFLIFCFLFLQIFPRKVWYFQLKYMLNVLTKQYKSIKCSSIVNSVFGNNIPKYYITYILTTMHRGTIL
jgi:hypothetical protein